MTVGEMVRWLRAASPGSDGDPITVVIGEEEVDFGAEIWAINGRQHVLIALN